MKFYQEPPDLKNQFLEDSLIQAYVNIFFPSGLKSQIFEDLQQLGQNTMEKILFYGDDAQAHEPELVNFDVWGNRVDEVRVADGWIKLREIAAQEGLINIGYKREFGKYSRTYQMLKIMLYTPSSAIFTCPLAMTDGATRLIELLAPDKLSEPYDHLTSTNPTDFWTAGQWMTEKEGGSDVSMSSTIARLENGKYRLYGDKWFTSAIDANIAMTLARIEEDGKIQEGNRGLSLFYLKIRDDDGNLNNITLHKLKDKLGTRALPTAELTLDGSEAELVGEVGKGVKQISIILNITRIYNAVSSIAYMQRGLSLTKNYASKRFAFGSNLDKLPLHLETLANLEVEYWGSYLLVFYAVELMGRIETGKATAEEEAIFRLLTPLVKLYTGKRSLAVISEVVESFGGIGYLEESGIPALLRDAQVFSIWEGTTNVLCLDVLRAIHKEGGLEPLLQIITTFSSTIGDSDYLKNGIDQISAYLSSLENDRNRAEVGARQFSYALAYLVGGYLLTKFRNTCQEDKLKHKIGAIYSRWTELHPFELITNPDRDEENNTILST